MNKYEVVCDRYLFDRELQEGMRKSAVVTIEADAMQVASGTLMFYKFRVGSSDGMIPTVLIAAFSEGEWNYARQVEEDK